MHKDRPGRKALGNLSGTAYVLICSKVSSQLLLIGIRTGHSSDSPRANIGRWPLGSSDPRYFAGSPHMSEARVESAGPHPLAHLQGPGSFFLWPMTFAFFCCTVHTMIRRLLSSQATIRDSTVTSARTGVPQGQSAPPKSQCHSVEIAPSPSLSRHICIPSG